MGVGIGLVAGPLLVLIDPELIPGPMLCSAVLLTAMITVRDRATADERGVRWLIVGKVPGMVLGALVVTWLSTTGLAIVFAFAILAIVAVSVAGLSLPRTTPALLGAGTVSGLMGTTLGVGGPERGGSSQVPLTRCSALGCIFSSTTYIFMYSNCQRNWGAATLFNPKYERSSVHYGRGDRECTATVHVVAD